MKILVCIDDTDNIDSRGTGELAGLLAKVVEKNGWGISEPVTRHQLLVHPDIPYTSHNSSMCFAAEIHAERLNAFIEFAKDFLTRESAEGSDPGLCVANTDNLPDTEPLISFGRKAKNQIVTKEEAYGLAKSLQIHLSEHGGTGLGIIGSLAGTGLRLSGNDGRFRGKFKLETKSDVVEVAEIKRQTGIHIVKSLDGQVLNDKEKIKLGDKVNSIARGERHLKKLDEGSCISFTPAPYSSPSTGRGILREDFIKAVLLEGKATLLVFPVPSEQAVQAPWQTCTKQQLSAY